MLGVEISENVSTDVCEAVFDAADVRYSDNGRLLHNKGPLSVNTRSPK